MAEVANRT